MSKFLSIIIPCYNCSKTIERLLDSILSNNLDRELYEVIISDDKSTDNFIELVKPYEEKMDIVYTETTRDFHCPGNTREAALPLASGEWITFIDNDDMYESHGLTDAITFIKVNNVDTMIATNFREWDETEHKYLRSFLSDKSDTWLHGKFYNKKNIIDKYNIHFKEDLFSHEDLYFNSHVLSNLIKEGKDFIYCDFYTYKWTYNPESLSRSYFNTKHFYIETYLNDYMYASSEPYFIEFAKTEDEGLKAFCRHQAMMTLLHGYFYYQAALYKNGNDVIKENLYHLFTLKRKINEIIGMSDMDIINYIYSMSPQLYQNVRTGSFEGSNLFVETQSFRDFILNL